jgi:DNA polymerase III delta prime subunit
MAPPGGAVLTLSATALLERLAGRPEQFPGALLLTGPSETLLESEARRLAAGLLCAGGDADSEASRECRRRVAAGMHPDLLVVLPEGVQIRIDAVREAVAFGAGKPYEAARRVAIVARADLLGLEASNALLKSLEEPGRHFHWILAATRAETLLPTIRSRCVSVPVALESRSDRVAAWLAGGFSAQDSDELAGLEPVTREEAPALLETHRRWRDEVLRAIGEGIARRRIAPLLLLAEALAHAPPERARLLAELLADAAVAAGTSSDLLRHKAVAGAIHDLARRRTPEALRRAALRAADVPADNRRGNKRLHYESVLLDLMED